MLIGLSSRARHLNPHHGWCPISFVAFAWIRGWAKLRSWAGGHGAEGMHAACCWLLKNHGCRGTVAPSKAIFSMGGIGLLGLE